MFNRRTFLRLSGLTAASDFSYKSLLNSLDPEPVRFVGDGPMYSPEQCIAKLQEINKNHPIERDAYGKGGSIDQLTKAFAEMTGKEAAIYLASGTLANQLAISVLSGENTKVFVQETSHVYRDEGDAAQSVFSKRLIPLASEKAFFTLEELQQSIEDHLQGEVFRSGFGAVSIENPVRRCDGQYVPISEIKRISTYCREKGYKLHLDGARIHLAAAFSGTSVAEYASHFDTIYISLYKYLGAPGGAMLCGPKAIIDRMEHLAKVHGGVIYMNWVSAAMALHHLNGIDDRFKKMATQSKQLFSSLNQLPGITITPLENGTNIAGLKLAANVNASKLIDSLWQKHRIALARNMVDNTTRLMVNDSLLNRSNDQIVAAFKEALTVAK
ncbi:beta-eliminating lyase-related protein [Spirosoma sp. SC4-14]|uniref:threonine aldolase family protein n=1 Tax=Spirosoma sp. SC4-14 TaxID=3128900 RepID=UPI0030CD88BB